MRDIEKTIIAALKRFDAGIKELKSMVLPADYYMDIKSLSRYSGISIRKLKDLIRHPECPLPAYKIDGSIKIKKCEFETWLKRFRLTPAQQTHPVDHIVRDIMTTFQPST
jgi:hypothetical protein